MFLLKDQRSFNFLDMLLDMTEYLTLPVRARAPNFINAVVKTPRGQATSTITMTPSRYVVPSLGVRTSRLICAF